MKAHIYKQPSDGNGRAAGIVFSWDVVRGVGAAVAIAGAVIAFGADWSPTATDRKIRAVEAALVAAQRLNDERFAANERTRELLMEQINNRFDSLDQKLDQLIRERRGDR